VAKRAATLGIRRVFQGAENKLEVWERLRAGLSLEPEECAHIGDDFPDLTVIARCGLGATVPHAPEPIRRRAHYVTRSDGGQGAVREISELILAAQGKLEALLASYGEEAAPATDAKVRRL
jgi:3-deoxy-D-manno-octulosonate 8-phosphate phosphatase (KDO 8-P phosphatase)